jgi:methionyl-tRNA synthetase
MAFEKKIYITTPLYYVNALPHLGHSYSTTVADVMARHYKQRGREVKFITGTDEHGEKIAQVAAKNNVSPQQWSDQIAAKFQSTWDVLGLEYDIFYRTTQKSHSEAVQNALKFLHDKGDIYFATYEGKYCLGCERLSTDTERTADGK